MALTKTPTLATGTLKVNHQHSRRNHKGFSLIEVLVVVVIIGVMVSLAAITLAPDDSATHDEGKRFLQVLEGARQQSVLFNKDLGVFIWKDSYEVLEWYGYEWVPLENSLFKLHTIPEHLKQSVWTQSTNGTLQEVLLTTREEREEEDDEEEEEEESSSLSFDISIDISAPSNNLPTVMPKLFFYATGEISPFEWRIEKDTFDKTDPWQIEGNILGKMELKEIPND